MVPEAVVCLNARSKPVIYWLGTLLIGGLFCFHFSSDRIKVSKSISIMVIVMGLRFWIILVSFLIS